MIVVMFLVLSLIYQTNKNKQHGKVLHQIRRRKKVQFLNKRERKMRLRPNYEIS
jgi:hypothetical protein